MFPLKVGNDMDEKPADENLVEFFSSGSPRLRPCKQRCEEEAVAQREVLADVESRIAATPAEGLRGLVVKLGLHTFLSDHAEAASIQASSAYSDLVRLTGHDPATEISRRFKVDEAE